MATENKGVMVYLPKEVEEYITNFCTEYSITRKDKDGQVSPSLGTGIVTFLKSKISGESPSDVLTKPKSLGSGLTRDEVLDLIRESSTNGGDIPSTGLMRDEVLDLIGGLAIPTNEQIEQLRGELAAVSAVVEDLRARMGQGGVSKAPIQDEPVQTADPNIKTWGEFHSLVGLEPPPKSQKTKANADIAIAKAIEMGLGEWRFSSEKRNFTKHV
jgi:hypothetical protein